MEKIIILKDGTKIDAYKNTKGFRLFLSSIFGFTYRDYVNDKNGMREAITFSYDDEMEVIREIFETSKGEKNER